MTKTTTVASKAFVAVVAAAMVFTLIAPAAKAATAEELQAQIAALMTQISALQGGGNTTTTTTTTTTSCDLPMAPLTMGAKGGGVTGLQNYLLTSGQSIPAGATGYFGAQTRSALAAWQSANGVMPAVGYYGPITSAAMKAKCVPTTPTTPTNPGTGTGTGTTPTKPTTSLKGEADLDEYTADDADDTSISESAEEADVAVFTAKFVDGDASISRLDVAFKSTGANAWDAFDTVSLWVDGKMVAEADASSKSDYLGDEADGVIRFSGLDIVAMEDEDTELTVKATMQGNLDAAELANAWTVQTVSMRYFDADDVATTDTTLVDNETASFDLDVAGVDDEVVVKSSSNNPVETTLQVEDNKKSDDYTVFAFDLDTKDSTSDITVNDVILTVTVSSSSYNTLVDDAELVIDGTTITDVTVTNGTGTTATLSFNVDGDVVIDAGDRVEAELKLTFKSLVAGNEGVTVSAAIAAGKVSAEGEDDFSSTGAATGKVHTLRTMGIEGEVKSKTASATVVDSTTNDYATYKVSVDVTAFNQDVLISKTPSTSIVYALENGAGVAAVAGSRTVNLTSTADETTNVGYFTINEGETKTITLDVTYVPGVANTAARLTLTSFKFDDVAGTPAQTWVASPSSDYRTDIVTIVN